MADVIDDIISRMQHKESEDTHMSSIKKRGLCYYSILGVTPTATQIEIKRAYQKKLTRYHPDKIEQTPVNLTKYKLIREAGDTLLDEHRRKAYDMEQNSTEMPSDFTMQKASFKEFLKLQEPEGKESREGREKKHPHIKTEQEKTMSKDEHLRRYEDTLMQREMEEVETSHSNIFAGRQFDAKEFNKLFVKKSRRQKGKEIVKHEELSAYCDGGDAELCSASGQPSWCDLGAAFDAPESTGIYKHNFAPIDADNEAVDTQDAAIDTAVGSVDRTNRVGRRDMNNDNVSIDSLDDNVYQEETKINDSDIEKLVADRKKIDKNLETFADAEYGSAIDDKFGVSHGLGFLVGTQMFGSQIRKPNIVIDDDKIKAYKALLTT